MIKKLQKISLFFNIEENLLKEISTFCKIKHFKKDEIIFFENEKDKYFYGILFGYVLMYDVDLKGNIIPINEFSQSEIFGLISQIQNKPYCLSAKAESELSVISIDYTKFKDYISQSPFSDRIIKMLSNHILKQMNMVKLNKFDSTTRVIYTILNFPEKLKKKKYLLAKELNMTPETLSRILSRLKNEGLICYCEGSIQIINKEKLQNMIKV